MSHRPRPTLESLDAAARPRPRTWAAVTALHDAALAAAAFPPSPEVHERALELLAQVDAMVRRLPARQRALGNDSGINGTCSRQSFNLGTAEWLAARAPADAEIDWRDPHAEEAVEVLLDPVILRAEEEGFASVELSVRDWVRGARGDAWPSDLAWLLDLLRGTGEAETRRAARWATAALPICWTLRGAGSAQARLSVRQPTWRPTMRSPVSPPMEAIIHPVRDVQRLPPAAARRAIAVGRETLTARCREVHAFSFANPAEVWQADTDAGTTVVLFGVQPAFRLALEANYGFMILANGVPVGYGGVSPLFRQANTGINIFAPFRGTEAAMLWTSALQVFHTLFGVTRFLVNPYQIGGGNAEAIDSGAYWFYDRLGFRPVDAEQQAVADRERSRQVRDARYRSERAVLRQLASSDIHLTLPGFAARDAFDEQWLPELSLRASAVLAAEGRCSRPIARERVAARMAKVLAVRPTSWSAAERTAFAEFAPFAALVPDLARWPLADRRGLAELMRAKGASCERVYAQAAIGQARFFHALGTVMHRTVVHPNAWTLS